MNLPNQSRPSRSASFFSPTANYHADRCEPLRQAVDRGEVRLVALSRRGYPGTPLPPMMLPEVSTVGYWDASGRQTWGLDWHRNEGIELTFLARGQTDFLVDRQMHRLESGHLTITRPWQEHRVGDPVVGSSRLHWLILDVGVRRPDQPWHWPRWLVLSPDDLRRLTTLLSHSEQPVWPASAALEGWFDKIGQLVETTEPLRIQTRLQLCLNELFVALLELLEDKEVVLDPRLVSTRRSVEVFLAELTNQVQYPWTLEEMAEHCGLRRSRFTEYCWQITNLTPVNYLAACRVEAAKQLMQAQPEASITDVALACGFQSSQYFATVFRRRTGVSPREFRQQRNVRSVGGRNTAGPPELPT